MLKEKKNVNKNRKIPSKNAHNNIQRIDKRKK